jgi:hypothetical protein
MTPSSIGRGARTHACSVHTRVNASLVLQACGGLGVPSGPGLLGGAANPGCSRLSAGSLRLAIGRFLPRETLPKGSSVARVNASLIARTTRRDESGRSTWECNIPHALAVAKYEYSVALMSGSRRRSSTKGVRARGALRSHERGTVPGGNVSCGSDRRGASRGEPAESRLQPGLAAPQSTSVRPVRHGRVL